MFNYRLGVALNLAILCRYFGLMLALLQKYANAVGGCPYFGLVLPLFRKSLNAVGGCPYFGLVVTLVWSFLSLISNLGGCRILALCWLIRCPYGLISV